MFILGITGRMQSGKDTIAEAVTDYFSPALIVRIGFADALKEEISLAIDQPVSYINEHKDNFRLILQGWGTDFRRELCGRDYWVHRWLNKAHHTPIHTCGVIAADVRFLNEAQVIHDLGGTIWRVERPSVAGKSKHPSEIQMDSIKADMTFVNHDSIETLKNAVKETLKEWRLNVHTTGRNLTR